jgi:hypothetical protein
VREAAAPAPVPASAVQAPAAQNATTPVPSRVQTAASEAGDTSQDAVQSRRREAAPAQTPARASKARPPSPTAVAPPPTEPLARTVPAAPPPPRAAQTAPAAPAAEAPTELVRESEVAAALEMPAISRLESRSRASSTQGAAAATADTARSFAPGAPPALALRSADPLEWLARELAERGDAWRWTWSGRPHPHGAPTQAWFHALRAETAGRWRRVDAAPDAPGASMQLFEGPRVRAEWRIATDRVLWMDPALGTWQATLAPEVAARLRSQADAF